MLRILIADDHDVVRHGVRAQLEQEPGWVICGEACNGREAVVQARELKPDIVVMDISMPELNGLEATRQIRHEFPETEVLMFTMYDSHQMLRASIEAGARAYLLKTDQTDHLNRAVRTLACHRPYFVGRVLSPDLVALLNSSNSVSKNDRLLSNREREVLQMLTEGRSNREVATRLQISVKTVETHRAAVMRKLDINSIVQLVRYAIRNQIVEV